MTISLFTSLSKLHKLARALPRLLFNLSRFQSLISDLFVHSECDPSCGTCNDTAKKVCFICPVGQYLQGTTCTSSCFIGYKVRFSGGAICYAGEKSSQTVRSDVEELRFSGSDWTFLSSGCVLNPLCSPSPHFQLVISVSPGRKRGVAMHLTRFLDAIISAFQSSLPQTCGKARKRRQHPKIVQESLTCSWKSVIKATPLPPPPPRTPPRHTCQFPGRAVGTVKQNPAF